MKIEEHVRLKERVEQERRPGRLLRRPFFGMVTYERPGMLAGTVEDFRRTTPGARLDVFDDGSPSEAKKLELMMLEKLLGVVVHRMEHGGVGSAWCRIMEYARDSWCDCAVLLEDDLRFSVSWLDVLTRMYVAAGPSVGFVSCHRCDDQPQKVELLGGIEAARVTFCTSQVNMVSAEFLSMLDLRSAGRAADEQKSGIDIQLHAQVPKLGRTSWVSARTYVGHFGHDASVARGHGYSTYPCKGVNRVYELVNGRMGWEPEPEVMP